MIHVDQTVTTIPGGNCFSACVASILHLPIEEVPYFMGDDDWCSAFERWCAPRGVYPICFGLRDDNKWRPAGVHILSGRSPRGEHDHAVVARGPRIVHDPHPDRTGLRTHGDVIILVPFDGPSAC